MNSVSHPGGLLLRLCLRIIVYIIEMWEVLNFTVRCTFFNGLCYKHLLLQIIVRLIFLCWHNISHLTAYNHLTTKLFSIDIVSTFIFDRLSYLRLSYCNLFTITIVDTVKIIAIVAFSYIVSKNLFAV